MSEAKPKKRVLTDWDGVHVDFVSKYLQCIRAAVGKTFKYEQVTQWDVGKSLGLSDQELEKVHRLLYSPGVASSLSFYNESLDAIPRLWDLSDLWIVTTPLDENPTWEFERRRQIERAFPKLTLHKRIYSVSEKAAIRGDIFIDDKFANAVAWADANPTGVSILWDGPWNRSWRLDDSNLVRLPWMPLPEARGTTRKDYAEEVAKLKVYRVDRRPNCFLVSSWKVVYALLQVGWL